MRYSPGYGDLDLEIQPKLLKLLDGEQIGITTNSSHLLLPQKSITALIGLSDRESDSQAQCDFNCNLCKFKECVYNRKEY